MKRPDLIVRIRRKTVNELEKYRLYPRETWDDIVNRVLDKVEGVKK